MPTHKSLGTRLVRHMQLHSWSQSLYSHIPTSQASQFVFNTQGKEPLFFHVIIIIVNANQKTNSSVRLPETWEWGYRRPGNEATRGLGMRLPEACEWGYQRPGNEATGGLGMRVLEAWEWGYWKFANEATGGLGMRLQWWQKQARPGYKAIMVLRCSQNFTKRLPCYFGKCHECPYTTLCWTKSIFSNDPKVARSPWEKNIKITV